MSKAVLISIRPQWCQKIASAEKTIEVRKTRPKLETPFKAYIYCTMPDAKDPHNILELHGADGKIRKANGKIIGEFTCDWIQSFDSAYSEWAYAVAPSGSVMPMHETKALELCKKDGCLSDDDVLSYFGDEEWKAYFWHISDLLIYDQPRELTAFRRACKNSWYCESCAMYWENNGTCGNESLQIRRPPQSWCYVEAMKDE